MKKPDGNKPKIHLGEEAPSSPYVIDLRRAELGSPSVSRSLASAQDRAGKKISEAGQPSWSPIEITPVAFDPRVDLVPTHEEVLGQLTEEDLTPGEMHVPFELSIRRLVDQPIGDVLSQSREQALQEAFIALDLPAEEEVEETSESPSMLLLDLDLGEDDEEPAAPQKQRIVWLPHGWQKAIASFVGLSFLFVLPLHAMQQVERAKQNKVKIESVSKNAISQLTLGSTAMKSSDYGLAADDFERASANFASAQADLDELSGAVDAVLRAVPETSATYTSLTALVAAGERLAKAAALFASALSDMRATTTDSPVTKLDILTIYLERMQPLLAEAAQKLDRVEVEALPAEHQATVATIATELPHLAKSVDEFLNFNQVIRTMLGAEEPMRYLVLFQNNTELRPTGGFIGSYAEMTVSGGKITSMEIPGGGSYDLQGSLQEFVEAPRPLQLLSARWEFQDGNWFPDFPESAKKLLWFYDHAGGPTVDGVLAVNATFVADLIDLLGPVDMPEYDRTIDSENFLFETQKIVEMEYDKTENKPKQFIADLAPKLLDRTTSTDTLSFLTLLQKVGDGFTTRDAQLYLKDPEMLKKIDSLGWSGKITQTEGDYLMVVDTNLGGGKTDLVVEQDVDVEVHIGDDGEIINTVTITREHKGLKSELFTGVNNVDYLRLYTPHGSELISASGDFAPPATSLFERSDLPLVIDEDLSLVTGDVLVDDESGTQVNDEFGKTVFGNWVQTKPGSTSVVTFTYRLPFVLESISGTDNVFDQLKDFIGFSETDRYTLFVQKQSGVETRRTRVQVIAPDNLNVLWSSDDALGSEIGTMIDGRTDAYVAQLFEVR